MHLHFSPLRRVQVHKDSDGRSYLVSVQSEEMSCGLAAVAMLIRQLNPAAFSDAPGEEHRLKEIAAKFPGSLKESDKLWAKEPIGEYGTLQYGSMASNVKALIKSQKIEITGHAVATRDHRTRDILAPARINLKRLAKPAVVLWGWYPDGVKNGRTGGHFTTLAGVTKAKAVVVLDPWDGSLSEIDPGRNYQSVGVAEQIFYTG